MRRTAHGDVEALSVLVSKHHASLLAYMYRLSGGDRSLAEDLTQESFIHVMRSRSYRPGSPFKPWLFSIATNLVRDHHRRQARRPSLNPDVDPDTLSSERHDPADEVTAREQRALVARAVACLDVEFRAVLLMRFFHDMPLGAIAKALDVPLGTVKSRLHVGVRRLRELLALEKEKQG